MEAGQISWVYDVHMDDLDDDPASSYPYVPLCVLPVLARAFNKIPVMIIC